jgi:serine/threonine protein kinase
MANKIPEIKISTVASTTTYIEDTIDPPIYEQEESSNYLHLDDRRRGKEYKDLDDLLRDVAIEHEDKDRIDSFWPSKLLATVLTRDRILEELIGLGDALVKQTLSDLADEIFTRHRKIFAILSLLGKGTCIVELMDDNLKDTDLPLVPCDAEKGYRHILARRTLPMVPLQCLQDWPPQLRKSFKEMQHRLSPAFLDLTTDPASGQRVVQHKEFESAVVLPFMECEQKEHGGYGIVSRVKIHSHCHGFCDILRPIETDQYFALKRIIKTPKAKQTNSDIDFWNEVDSLKRFSGFSHEHLVTLLMTWTIRDRYYLLFPLAECDLDRYWESKTIPEDPYNQLLDIETLEWLLEQVHGMTDALDKIHNPSWNTLSPQDQFGRHGDLKPENVLWYRSTAHAKGIFVIADLGLAKLNSVLSRSAAPNSEVHATPRYRPPEYDLKGAKISRSYDIWTFGCLLLELVCWALGKSEAREQFAKARMSPYVTGSCSDIFFDVKRKTKDADNTERGGFVILVKEQVTKQIARLHNDPRCSLFFHDLLYLIEEDMIIVLSATKSRISSSALLQKLADMRTRAENEGSEYLQRPCPQPRLPNCYDPVDAVLTFLTEDQVDRLHVHTGLSQRPENVI